MSNIDVEKKVKQIISDQFDINIDTIKPEDNIARCYGAKSHDMIQLSAGLQLEYGIKITYIQSRAAKTVDDWISLVKSLKTE